MPPTQKNARHRQVCSVSRGHAPAPPSPINARHKRARRAKYPRRPRRVALRSPPPSFLIFPRIHPRKSSCRTRTPRAEPISLAETRRRGEFESYVKCSVKVRLHPIGEGNLLCGQSHKFQFLWGSIETLRLAHACAPFGFTFGECPLRRQASSVHFASARCLRRGTADFRINSEFS